MRATILVADGGNQARHKRSDGSGPAIANSGSGLHKCESSSVKHTCLGMEVHDGTGIPIYYVTDFKITKSDYLE
jgi:hypothetical protein